MARLSQFLLLAVSVVYVNAAPRSAGKTQYAPRVIPNIWKAGAAAPASSEISFDLIFAPKDAAGLEERMLEIAIAPGEKSWLSEEEIASYIAPSDDAKAAVEAAIKDLGSYTYSRNGDTVTVKTTVEKAASFLATEFKTYTRTDSNTSHFKTTQYTIPASIEQHIADISPIATFTRVTHHSIKAELNEAEKRELMERAAPAGCSTSSVTSACIRSLYGFNSYTPTTSTGTPRLGIMAFIAQNFNSADLKTYLTKYRSEAAGYTIPVVTADGAINIGALPGVEAALDTQTAAGIIYPLPSTFYDIGTIFTSGDIFLLAFQYFLGLSASARPSVITISYGSLESDFTSTQANSMCTAAQQLTAAGMTIVVSSGDSGVGGQSGAACPAFVPTYPGGCQYILSVGATQGFSPEVMVDTSLAGFYSGAGFSKIWSTPSYQTAVVSAYETALGSTDSGDYNKAGRAFPDVTAQGSLQNVVASGSTELVGGTSASAPIFASGLTLLNDLLVKAGKATVGWANPTFYANPSAFTDITSGGSYACGSGSLGLPAKSGWDASAGLGTPVFASLRSVYGV